MTESTEAQSEAGTPPLSLETKFYPRRNHQNFHRIHPHFFWGTGRGAKNHVAFRARFGVNLIHSLVNFENAEILVPRKMHQ